MQVGETLLSVARPSDINKGQVFELVLVLRVGSLRSVCLPVLSFGLKLPGSMFGRSALFHNFRRFLAPSIDGY